MRSNISPLFVAGLLVLFIGAAGDLTYHGLHQGNAMFRSAPQQASERDLDAIFGRDGSRAHLVTLGGMVVTVAGVMQRGLSRRRS